MGFRLKHSNKTQMYYSHGRANVFSVLFGILPRRESGRLRPDTGGARYGRSMSFINSDLLCLDRLLFRTRIDPSQRMSPMSTTCNASGTKCDASGVTWKPARRDIARTREIPDGCLIARRGEGSAPSPRMGNYFTKRTTIKNVNNASDSINATPISIAN